MKSRYLTLALLTIMVSVLVAFSAQAMTVLGNHPFYKPPLTSIDEFRQLVQVQQADIQKGFEIAGVGPLFDSFMAQIGSADIKQVEYYQGQKFHWML